MPEPKKRELRMHFVADSVRVVDEDERIIEGIATTEEEDEYGTIVSREAVEEDLARFLGQRGNLWEMHRQPVGRILEAEYRDDGLWIRAKVADDRAWNLVRNEVYTGLSLAWWTIEWEEFWSTEDRDENYWKITKLELREVSLCDVGATPGTGVTEYRNAGLFDRLGNLLQRLFGADPDEEVEMKDKEIRALVKEVVGEELKALGDDLEARIKSVITEARSEPEGDDEAGEDEGAADEPEARNSDLAGLTTTVKELAERQAALTETVEKIVGTPIESRVAPGQDGEPDEWSGVFGD
jgi:HK97 family phage prohead protease